MAINEKYKPGHVYAVDGATLNGLLAIAVELMASDTLALREDVRRDYGRWIQARLDNLDELPDEVA
jgi:hypothetical protein